MLRVTFDLVGEPRPWWGLVMLPLGLITALYGAVFAAVQTDMKRLLGYSSVENIGIDFAGAGLEGVEVTPIDIPTQFANFDDYWKPFLGGQGPAPAYAMSLDEAARARLRDRIRERIPTAASGAIVLTARAWATRAIVAE